MTAKEIANLLHVSEGQVRKVAKFYNIEVEAPQEKRHPLWEQIVQRVQEIGNGYTVDDEFGLSPGSAKRMCRKFGIGYEPRMGRQKLIRTQNQIFQERPDWKQMYDMYQEGQTHKQIANYFEISQPSVNRVLKNLLGIHVGKGNHNPKKVYLPDSVGDIYLSGKTCQEIGEQFGTSRKVVQKKLTQLNIPRRIGKAEGPKNPQWKGGKEIPVHYFRRQSYEVAAICLKMPVPKGHVIHHIDENPKNNHPTNLMIFPNNSLHTKFHQLVLKNRWRVDSKEAIQKALEIGGVLLPKPDTPFQL